MAYRIKPLLPLPNVAYLAYENGKLGRINIPTNLQVGDTVTIASRAKHKKQKVLAISDYHIVVLSPLNEAITLFRFKPQGVE